jgi:outer membrane protein
MKKTTLIALMLASAAAAAQENELTLSGGIAAAPRYAGSDKTQAAPLIGIDYQMANGFFASTLRGIGYGEALGAMRMSAALGYRGERSDSKSSSFGGRRGDAALRGMGDVKGSATAVLGASIPLSDRITVSGSLEAPLTQRENGRMGSLAVSGTVYEGHADRLTLGVSASAADNKYMQTYFGVTAAQAARTKFKRYTPKAGVHQADINLAWAHRIDQRWSITGVLGAATLLGGAKDSPLVRRRTSPTAAVYASYRY